MLSGSVGVVDATQLLFDAIGRELGAPVELCNLANDPAESRNVLDGYPDVIRRLHTIARDTVSGRANPTIHAALLQLTVGSTKAPSMNHRLRGRTHEPTGCRHLDADIRWR